MARQFTWQQRSDARTKVRERFKAGEFAETERKLREEIAEVTEDKEWQFEISIRAKGDYGYTGFGQSATLTFSGDKDIASAQLVGITSGSMRNLLALAIRKFIYEAIEDKVINEGVEKELERMFPAEPVEEDEELVVDKPEPVE